MFGLDIFRRSSKSARRDGRGSPTRPRGRERDDELFDEEFQRRLEVLALASRRVYAGRLRAERRSKKTGSGIEFADHREYVPGDDFRSLDWNVYQRTGRLLVRLFEEEEDLSVYFLLDVSRSMGAISKEDGGDKLRYGKRLVAALAYVALANLDRVSIVGLTGESEAPTERLQPTRGKRRIFKVFEFLRPLVAKGPTSLAGSIRTFAAQNKRRGLAILVSDLYDPAGFEDAINQLRYAKFDPHVLHIVDPSESKPALHGDVQIVDCETGEAREITVTPRLLAQFEKAREAYLKEIEDFCGEKGVAYFRMSTDVPFDEAVLHVLRGGGLLR